jgi:pimeloyl-ACP methyl ester carboxylesterase
MLRTLLAVLTVSAAAGDVAAQAQTPAPFAVEVRGTGRPMILIPGMTSAGEVWDSTAAHFGNRYETHVLTLAGFAGQPPLADGPFLPTVRDAIIDYIRTRQLERPVLVGHSLGGFLVFAIAAAAPELVGPVVAVDGVPFLVALGDTTATEATMAAQAAQLEGVYASLTAEQMEGQGRMAAIGMVTDTTYVGRIAAWSRNSDPATAGRALAEMLTTDLRSTASAIRSPVLLFMAGGGAPSAALEGMAARYRAQLSGIPDARVAVAANARHFIMYDDPAFLHDTIDQFLSAHP